MQSIRSHFGNNFELIRWIVYLFLGGAANASFAQVYVDYLLRLPQLFQTPLSVPLGIVLVWIPIGLIALAPLFLSLVLTRINPEKQLIPPLYINIVSLAWFAGFIAIRYPSEIYPILLVYVFFAFIVGGVENKVASSLLGITVSPEDFLRYSFVVHTPKERIRDTIEIEPIRNTLGLTGVTVSEDKPTIDFESRAVYGYQMSLRVVQIPPENHSTVIAIFYDRTDWYVKAISDHLKEYAESVVVYLKSIFDRPEHRYSIDHDTWDRNVHTETLVSETMDSLEGFIPRSRREITRTGWVKIVAFVVALGVIGYSAFALQDYPTSTGLFVALLLYLAFELRSSAER